MRTAPPFEKRWCIVVNPAAASGRAVRLLPKLEKRLKKAGIAYSILMTTHPGHSLELVQDAIRRGERNFAAFGGDGTVNELANAILSQHDVPIPRLLMTQLPTGTGNDWRRTMGIPTKMDGWIDMLQDPIIVTQDVGLCEWQTQGRRQVRYFVNIAGFGFDAFVGVKANKMKAMGRRGVMGYIGALVRSLTDYIPTIATIRIDGHSIGRQFVFSGAIGICKFNGGGMMPCPDAQWDDGLLDMTLIGDISTLGVIVNIPFLFNGEFVSHPKVTQKQGTHFYIGGGKDLLVEVDGEVICHCPVTIFIQPLRLRVAVGRSKLMRQALKGELKN